jgi:hypothetical protein
MKRLLLLFALLFAAPLALADDCSDYERLASLYELRALMLRNYSSSYDLGRVIDRRVESLREPLGNGEYRWVRWVRPNGDAPVEKDVNTVVAAEGAGDPDTFEADSHHTFAVRIAVPRKRSLTKANNPVWVGTARVRYSAGGRTQTKTQAINAWMNPDTSRTIDLGVIADRADVSIDAATAPKDQKQSVVEIHFVQAVSQDDPANPGYETIRLLERIRNSPDARTIDYEIASLERELFGSESLPMLALVNDLRRADEWMRSKNDDEKVKGERLLRETLRRIR